MLEIPEVLGFILLYAATVMGVLVNTLQYKSYRD